MRLRALQEAERSDPELAFDLARGIAADRLLERLVDDREATEFDVALLFRAGRYLARGDAHEDALYLLAAARALATRIGDGRWAERIAVHGALSSVALLDFTTAEEILREVLRLPPEVALRDDSTLDRLRSDEDGEGVGDRSHPVTLEAMYAVGRLLAARGEMSAAIESLSRCLAFASDHPSPWISASDLALFLAETMADAGRADEALAVAEEWSRSPGTDLRTRLAWRLLEGTAYFARGELSHAERCFGDVYAEGVDGEEAVVRSSLWQRAQVLALLNRLDEATTVAEQLRARGGQDVASVLDALMAARRGGVPAGAVPPSPREILTLPVALEALPPPPHDGPPEDEARPMEARSRERVRDEWAHRSNAVQAALRSGDDTLALERFAVLSAWIPRLDAPLVTARHRLLTALVAYALGSFDEACEAASRAMRDFEELGMAADAWGAARVLYSALKKASAPADEISSAAQRASALLTRMQESLLPTDRVYHQLNKWSAVDDVVSAWCDELAHDAGTAEPPESHVARVLHRITVVKGWDALLQHSRQATEADRPPPGVDVFGWARERLHARRGARGIAGYDLPLHRWWIPRDTAIVHHVVLPERIEVFVASRRGVQRIATSTTVGRPELMGLVKGALRVLAAETPWDGSSRPLQTLEKAMGLREIEETLPPGTRRLFFVPDDVLLHLPLAGIPLRGSPLVTRYELTILPHHRWVARGSSRTRRFDRGLAVVVRESDVEPGWERLGDAEEEVRGLSRVSRGGARVLRDAEARIDPVGRAMQAADCVHFACHGEFRFDDPMSTGLLMHDGWLTLRELERTDLSHVDLLVTAACFGADTKVLPGRELVSLPGAFIEAGAQAVLAPLWEVFEESSHDPSSDPTADFFAELYGRIPREGASAALAAVQRAWAGTRPVSDWAGYQLLLSGIQPGRPLRWALPVITWWRSARSRAGRP